MTDVSKERSRNYRHQIKGAIVYKVGVLLAQFLSIPIMIHYLGQEQFGVWSTLLSIMSWILVFDLGVGHGMRNKVAEALAKNEKPEAAKYIASGYSLFGLIALALWGLVTGASFFVPWQSVFNTHSIPEDTLRLTVQVAIFFIVLNFWIGLIRSILGAVQKTSIAALGQLISNMSALFFVFFLTKTTDASITYLALAYGISLVIANIGLSWWFYRDHPELRPKPYLDKQHITPLLSVGMQFFVIQIAVLVMFTIDKILITQLLGPEYVTQYDVVFKVFNLVSAAHMLILVPLWTAYTDAYHRKDMVWIKRMFHKQLMIFTGVIGVIFIMGLLMKSIVALWIGHEMAVSQSLVMSIGLFFLVSSWNNIYTMFVNGIGEIKLQLYMAVIGMVINIPLAIYFVKCLDLGLSGVVLAAVVSSSLLSIALPIQVSRIIRKHTKVTVSVIDT
jgi:O-antigen/teichoic acid export membrane protein